MVTLLKVVAATIRKVEKMHLDEILIKIDKIFYSKMNSLAVIFEKPKKMRKIADFANFEPLWSLNESFAGHAVWGKMLGI